jgi:hypothetical protein
MKKYFLLLLLSITICIYPQHAIIEMAGYNVNVIQTSLPFLEINSNARIGALGEIGCVASPFYKEAGVFQNPALLSNGRKSAGINYNYMPWEHNNHINFKGVNAYYSPDTINTFGYYFDYFTFSEIIYNDDASYTEKNPYEFYHQLSYSRIISKSLSLGIGFKYIRSHLYLPTQTSASIDNEQLNTYSFDIGVLYSKSHIIDEQKVLHYSIGGAITNFGPKVTYVKGIPKNFIPAMLKIGGLVNPEFILNPGVSLNIDLMYQAEKYLVPSPPVYSETGSIVKGKDPDISIFEALYQSFYDAPDGFSEELHEILHKFGGEIRLNVDNKLYVAARMGKFLEHKTKGNRKYTTTGIGIGASGFTLDYRTVDSENIYVPKNWAVTLGLKVNLENRSPGF